MHLEIIIIPSAGNPGTCSKDTELFDIKSTLNTLEKLKLIFYKVSDKTLVWKYYHCASTQIVCTIIEMLEKLNITPYFAKL